ncbi:MAG: phosphoserine phosphatase [Polyangiaceae bacterium]|nr:phosphoserine phosphatase [Polyangiaceae bacterium]
MKLRTFHLSLPKDGEILSGDAVVVRTVGSVTLVAVLDALGHGHLAAPVAERGRAYLEKVHIPSHVQTLTEGLHDALRGTRGAAGMCCLLRDGRVQGCGVGNVELRAPRTRVPVVLTPGILGVSLRKARTFEGAFGSGGRLILFSDGISPRMDLDKVDRLSPEETCRALLDRYRRPHDDATLLVVDSDEAQ